MSALRKAGVWLGLVEEYDERLGGYDDEYGDDEDLAPAARPRSIARPPARTGDRELRANERAADRSEFAGYGRGADRDFQPDSAAARESYRDLRVERERVERDRIERERAERDRIERDRAERDRAERDRAERERAERDRIERDRIDRERSELERLERDRVERDRAERERVLQAERVRAERVRAEEPRTATVRQLARPGQPPATASGISTQDNLALAPQVQLRERAVVSDDKSRRMQITTFHPTTYPEARAIGEHFRDGFPVIMNLTEMDEPDAKRLVDFAAGLAFGLRGSMDRVTNRVFLLSPANITVSAEDKARIAEGGFFDQG